MIPNRRKKQIDISNGQETTEAESAAAIRTYMKWIAVSSNIAVMWVGLLGLCSSVVIVDALFFRFFFFAIQFVAQNILSGNNRDSNRKRTRSLLFQRNGLFLCDFASFFVCSKWLRMGTQKFGMVNTGGTWQARICATVSSQKFHVFISFYRLFCESDRYRENRSHQSDGAIRDQGPDFSFFAFATHVCFRFRFFAWILFLFPFDPKPIYWIRLQFISFPSFPSPSPSLCESLFLSIINISQSQRADSVANGQGPCEQRARNEFCVSLCKWKAVKQCHGTHANPRRSRTFLFQEG